MKLAFKLSLRQHCKLKESKLLGIRKSYKHNFKLNRPRLKANQAALEENQMHVDGQMPADRH